MHIRALIFFVFVGFCVCASAESATAIPCVLASRGSAAVLVGGVEKAAPLRLDDCRQASVVRGEVAACFLDKNEQKLCKAVKVGQMVGDVLAAPGAEGSPSIGTTLVALLRGDATVRTGSSRGGSSLEGFPYGTVLLADNSLLIDAGARLSTSGTRLDVFGDSAGKAPIFSIGVTQATIPVPSQLLIRGASYHWQLQTSDHTYSGRFEVADSEFSQELSKARTLLGDPTLAPIEKDLLLVDLYHEVGCAFERDQVLARLR